MAHPAIQRFPSKNPGTQKPITLVRIGVFRYALIHPYWVKESYPCTVS